MNISNFVRDNKVKIIKGGISQYQATEQDDEEVIVGPQELFVPQLM
jgi:hypothetical protein